jgi:hypothetical protein
VGQAGHACLCLCSASIELLFSLRLKRSARIRCLALPGRCACPPNADARGSAHGSAHRAVPDVRPIFASRLATAEFRPPRLRRYAHRLAAQGVRARLAERSRATTGDLPAVGSARAVLAASVWPPLRSQCGGEVPRRGLRPGAVCGGIRCARRRARWLASLGSVVVWGRVADGGRGRGKVDDGWCGAQQSSRTV